ncbi:MAG: T9SS type A sorting domain-containing protein [Aureispira sp.]
MKNSLTIAFLLLCTFSLFTLTTQAQVQDRAIHATTINHAPDHTTGKNCHAHINLQDRIQTDPTLADRLQRMEAETQQYIRENVGTFNARSERTIPVYVHVIYRTSNENISTAQIQSQIDQLNADFSGTNSDFNSVPLDFRSVAAADTKIRFNLVNITRKSTTVREWGTSDNMKRASSGGVNPITPSTHLNMWVCNIGQVDGNTILGYAQFPDTGPLSTDGVVMSPQFFGSRNFGSNPNSYYLSAPIDRGRTTTHEVGHYFNLRHIWGDGGCNVDDFVDDTPTAGNSNYGCPSSNTNSCSGGQRDMFMNYMDYVDDNCMFMFTKGQRNRMIACLNTSRSDLGSGSICNGPYTSVELNLVTDQYGSETSWTVKNASGTTVESGSGYGNTQTRNFTWNLPDGLYTFEILDTYGDGILGNGGYTLKGNGVTFATGSGFGSSASESFCVGNSNSGGNSGGGGNFSYSESFNANFGNWTQSSSDNFNWTRISGSTPSSGTGPNSAADGSHYIYTEASSPNSNGKRAIITSPSLNFSNLGSNGTLSFQYHMYSSRSAMGSVQLQVSTNNGGSWTTVWSKSGNQGNQWRTANVSLSNYAGNSAVRLRFNAVTGGWSSDISIDDLEIGSGSNRTASNTTTNTIADVEEVEEITATQINLYPNPANTTINVDLGEITTNYTGRIVDATGRTVWVGELEAGANAINIATLSTGMYYVAVVKANGEVITKKFVKE